MTAKGVFTAQPLTIKKIHDRCDEVGDCIVWAQCVCRGRPQIGEQGKTVNPRRRVYELHNGVKLPPTKAVIDTCGDLLCCNPRHLVAIPSDQVAPFMSKQGRLKNSPAAKARKALVKRAQSKRSEAEAAEVREVIGAGLPVTDVAEAYGMSDSHAYRIVRGQCWRPTAHAASIFSMGGV